MEHYLSTATIDAIKTLVGFMKANSSWHHAFIDYVELNLK